MTTTSGPLPDARSPARRSSETKLQATGTDGPIPSVSGLTIAGPKPLNQNRQKRSTSPSSDASITLKGKSKQTKNKPRLLVRQAKGANTGTILSGVKEFDDLCTFTLRVTDNGRRIHLRYRDEHGARRYPYACHLDSAEWRQLTRRVYRSAVDLIAEKTAGRTDGDPAKIRQAVERINLLRAALDE